jgi:hypothetical protein
MGAAALSVHRSRCDVPVLGAPEKDTQRLGSVRHDFLGVALQVDAPPQILPEAAET